MLQLLLYVCLVSAGFPRRQPDQGKQPMPNPAYRTKADMASQMNSAKLCELDSWCLAPSQASSLRISSQPSQPPAYPRQAPVQYHIYSPTADRSLLECMHRATMKDCRTLKDWSFAGHSGGPVRQGLCRLLELHPACRLARLVSRGAPLAVRRAALMLVSFLSVCCC